MHARNLWQDEWAASAVPHRGEIYILVTELEEAQSSTIAAFQAALYSWAFKGGLTCRNLQVFMFVKVGCVCVCVFKASAANQVTPSTGVSQIILEGSVGNPTQDTQAPDST